MDNWTLHLDEFSKLYSIKDEHGHLVCEHVGKAHAERIVSAVNAANQRVSDFGPPTPEAAKAYAENTYALMERLKAAAGYYGNNE